MNALGKEKGMTRENVETPIEQGQEFVALVHNHWGDGLGVKWRRFTFPTDYNGSPNSYYCNRVDYTSEILMVLPATEWLGEWVKREE